MIMIGVLPWCLDDKTEEKEQKNEEENSSIKGLLWPYPWGWGVPII